MNKLILQLYSKIKEKDIINYVIIFIIALLVSLPWLKITSIGLNDGNLHLLRLIGLDEAIKNAEFPFIITPFFCNNFGYATNLFYPQIVTYIPYILKIFTPSFTSAMELFACLTIIFSGIFMYNCTKQITNNKIIALISSIIYMTFPYRFENIYERFAIGEFTAQVFIPLVFQGLDSLINKDKSKHYLIAIGIIGMLLSHTLTVLYVAIFSALYVLYNAKSFFKKDVIKKCLINAFFIILTTALFTVPLIEHKLTTNYTIFNAEIMHGTGEYVDENSATLKKLLTDKDSDKTVSFMIGTPIIIYILLGIISFKKLSSEDKKWYYLYGLLAIISLYMTTKLFPWRIMPNFLTMIQFSWRMLVFFNFFIAPICAINIYIIAKNINSKIFLILCILLLAIFTVNRLNQFVIEKQPDIERFKHYESDVLKDPKISHMMINREYLPEKAIKLCYTYLETREDRVYVLNGQANILSEEKTGLNMSFQIENCAKDTILELPYIYYLGYEVNMEMNGKEEKIEYVESENGFVSIIIQNEVDDAKIIVKYKGTILEKSAYIVSAVGLIGLVTYIIIYKRKEVT